MAVTIEVTRENPEPSILALVNPVSKRRKHMARTKGPTVTELRDENESLREENETLQAALDEANNRLAQIYDLSAEEIEPEDFEDTESEDTEGEEES